MDEEAVVPADLVAGLAGRLEERQRLDVADGAADLGDDDVDVVAAHREDAVLDLVGDVRDHLHGVAEVVAAALLGDHRRVDLARRDVGDLVEVGVEESLVVADVEVRLRPVVGHEDLAVLERVHRPRIDVEVGVELLHGHAQSAGLQEAPRLEAVSPLPSEEATPPVTNTCLVGVRFFTGFEPTPAGPDRRHPTHRRTPPGVLERPGEGEHGGHLAGRRLDPVDGRDLGGDGLGTQASELPLAAVGACRPTTTTPAAARDSPVTSPARIASPPSAAGSSPRTSSTSGARRSTSAGAATQVGAGEALEDRPALAVGGLALGRGGGDREAQELADPVVRRRLGGDRVALLGHQLAAEGVDEGLLVGSDHRLGEVVARRHRSPGGGDPLGERR